MAVTNSKTQMPALFRLAVLTGPQSVVSLHLERGADPNGRDHLGNTPLILAATRCRAEICQVLLNAGADSKLTNRFGRTAHSIAFASGHTPTIRALTGDGASESLRNDLVVERREEAEPSQDVDLWEVDAETEDPAEDAAMIARATAQQQRIGAHAAMDIRDDWADVVIELPRSERIEAHARRTRSSVRFRRLRMGVTSRQSQVATDLQDAVVALDLARSPDEILKDVTLAQVIRSADTSPELRRCVPRSRLFEMLATDFLADDNGEEKFRRVPGLEVDDYLELCDLMNAFTVLVHQEAGRVSSPGPGTAAPDGPLAVSRDPPQRAVRRDPDEVLAGTPLSQIVIAGSSSPALRRAIARTDRFGMSAAEFLQEEDGEAIFRSAAGLDPKSYLELSDLINEFTRQLYEDARLT